MSNGPDNGSGIAEIVQPLATKMGFSLQDATIDRGFDTFVDMAAGYVVGGKVGAVAGAAGGWTGAIGKIAHAFGLDKLTGVINNENKYALDIGVFAGAIAKLVWKHDTLPAMAIGGIVTAAALVVGNLLHKSGAWVEPSPAHAPGGL